MYSASLLRRAARRLGFRLSRSRWRLGSYDNHGLWQVLDAWHNHVVFGANYDASDEDVAWFLGLQPND